jgi:hypothetical protein
VILASSQNGGLTETIINEIACVTPIIRVIAAQINIEVLRLFALENANSASSIVMRMPPKTPWSRMYITAPYAKIISIWTPNPGDRRTLGPNVAGKVENGLLDGLLGRRRLRGGHRHNLKLGATGEANATLTSDLTMPSGPEDAVLCSVLFLEK